MHQKLINVSGYQGSLCALSGGVAPREVVDKDVVMMPQEVPIHKGYSGPGHG